MTPDEKKLYALMAVAEQQQNLVNQAVKELQITKEHIQSTIAEQTHHTVSKSLNTGLQEGTAELIKTAKALGRLNNSIESASYEFFVENHRNDFRNFYHSYAWHHLVI